MSIFIIILLILFAIVIALDLFVGALALKKDTPGGKSLGIACISAAFVTASYFSSVFIKNYFFYSVLSSLYFIGIDVALIELAVFVRYFTLKKNAVPYGHGWKVLFIWTLLDVIFLTVNPFYEISIHYIYHDSMIANYTYEMKLPYELHLLLAYVLILVVLVYLMRKITVAPSIYRRQYFYAIIALLVVVVINCFYLYMPSPEGIIKLDYSLLGYSVAASAFYWSCFVYTPNGMMNLLRSVIFERIDQGLLLFDYEDNLTLENGKAREFFVNTTWRSNPTIENLLHFLDAEISPEELARLTDGKPYSFQCYPSDGRPLKCDYSALLSKKRDVLGRLFVFSELSSEFDPLTGFYNLEAYKNQCRLYAEETEIAAVCDINGLAYINSKAGQNAGNQAIQILARQMRKIFPPDTVFIRGHEAILIALCRNLSEIQANEILKTIEQQIAGERFCDQPLGMQSAIKCPEPSMKTIDLLLGSIETLRIRKILNQNSKHSEVLYSLIQTLQECDPDTEAHVRRTQKLGARLGQRIGLSEEDQSKLALLAILHDIGKITIPLDILNKPGRLTEAEWRVLKTHVEKGYQIACSVEGFKGIAEMILYHHERWDGKGYPSGLSKESIPLLSRMISVVDAYDAMVNDRAYRPAMPKEQAYLELKRCAGTQFDPSLVSAFLQLLQEDGINVPSEIKPAVQAEPNHGTSSTESWLQWSSQSQEVSGEHLYQIHSMEFGRYVLDVDYRIRQADGGFEQMTGYSAEDINALQLTQLDLIFEDERKEYIAVVKKLLDEKAMAYLEHKIRRKDGRPVYIFCFGRVFYDSAERETRIEAVICDCSSSFSIQSVIRNEQSKALQRLERWENKFRRDSLTGLLNHEAFKNDAETRILAGPTQAMMLMIDVDHFKKYNDLCGHRAGDEFLILVAQTLMSSLRKEDFACRMGGDEFAVLLFFREETSKSQITQRAFQICDRLNRALTSSHDRGTTISMGGAFLDEECNTFDRLYEAADRALYKAKNGGRGKLCF